MPIGNVLKITEKQLTFTIRMQKDKEWLKFGDLVK